MSYTRSNKRYQFLLAIMIATVASPLTAQELTLERIVSSSPSLIGTSPIRPLWSPDSSSVAFLWNEDGHPFRDVWRVDASGGTRVRLTELGDTGASTPAVSGPREDPLTALARRYRTRTGASDLTWTPDGSAIVFACEGHLFRVSADGGEPERLTETPGSRRALAYSPDGRILSWLQDGDLWFWSERTEAPLAVTRVGEPPIGVVPGARHTRLDRELSSYRWSPDSRHVAAHLDDRRAIRRETIPNYLGEATEVRELRRDYPGDHDYVRAIEIYSVESGRLRQVELPERTAAIILTYEWSSAAEAQLLIDQISEDAVDRWLWVADPDDASLENIWHDHRQTRNSQRLTTSVWRSDGQAILFTADLDGRHRLHSVTLADRKVERLTSGDWSVVAPRFGGAALDVAAASGEVLFVSTQQSPYERQVYRMPEDGGTVSAVTSHEGVYQPYLSPDGTKLALLHSNDTTPTELYLTDAHGESPVERVTHSPPEEFGRYEWVKPRYVTFKSHADSTMVHGRLLEPPNLDRTKQYAAIIGPVYSNTARNMWTGLTQTYEQYLAQRGYLVLQVDIRGSSGYGRTFREDLFLDYGGIDIEDLHGGADFLKSLPYVDPERVGIWGWSYGGLLTSMSMFKKPGVYQAGVAGAPATNVWHALTGQTDNARRPRTHPEVYRNSSAVSFGEDLEDHFMLIHGLQDSVVLFKDSVTLAEKLMMLEKNFDFVILPSATHNYRQKSYVARFVLTKVTEYFDRHLGRGPRDSLRETDSADGGSP